MAEVDKPIFYEDDPRLVEKRVDDIKVALGALKFVLDMQSEDYPMGRERLAYERLRELPADD